MNIKKGDIYEFGRCEALTGKKSPIRWKVLKVQKDNALLLSENVLRFLPFHDGQMEDISWEISTLREWLNGEFFEQAFTVSERKGILKTVLDPGNVSCFFGPHRPTKDRVFLLSLDEMSELSTEDINASPAPYLPCRSFCCCSKHDGAGWVSYWLRSPAAERYKNFYVGPFGKVENQGEVPKKPLGVRPAIWVNLCASSDFMKKAQENKRKIKVPRELVEDFEMMMESIVDEEDGEDEDEKCELQSLVGKTFLLGKYPQNHKNQPLPIEWRVLSVDTEKALVIAECVLDTKPFNGEEDNGVFWDTSSLRKWLNSEFLGKAFNSDEQAYILSTTNESECNPDYLTSSGEKTTDHVFLLSCGEVVEFLKDGSFYESDGAVCIPTKLAVQNGAALSQDIKTKNRRGKWEATSTWWLRTSGDTNKKVMFIRFDGSMSVYGDYASEMNGVRPAMFISKDALSYLFPELL